MSRSLKPYRESKKPKDRKPEGKYVTGNAASLERDKQKKKPQSYGLRILK